MEATDLQDALKIGKPILQYKNNSVDFQDATQIFIRDTQMSEDKSSLDKLVVIILHGNTLYQWTQVNKETMGKGLTKITQLGQSTFRVGRNDNIFFLKKNRENGITIEQDIIQLSIGHVMLD